MNDNSSRFGKYTRLYFDQEGHAMGIEINEYLLEKVSFLFLELMPHPFPDALDASHEWCFKESMSATSMCFTISFLTRSLATHTA